MNVTELARRLKVTPKELQDILPAVGIDIGRRAIKIDGRQAQRVMEMWPRLIAEYRAKQRQAQELQEQAVIGQQQRAPIEVPPRIRVRDFAEKLKLPLPKVIGELMKNGILSSMNQEIDFETAAIVGSELGFEIIEASKDQDAAGQHSQALAEILSAQTEGLQPRPPVVVVMGHVDHGKTKLLDAIRQTNVMAGESGGITQHIGAYQVRKKDRDITFIDTPGHEAFITMRSRGARVADIAILVVAADDSIQEQTKESIKIIHSAKLPMIVAINKIDKPDANLDRVKQDLSAIGLTPEDWGGQTITVPISAKVGTGIETLLDMVLLVADMEKERIQANPAMEAAGTIIDSHVDRASGPVATVLIQTGTLHAGEHVTVSGSYYGKIRAMKDYRGQLLEAAGPSVPVRVHGLKAAPSVGDVLQVTQHVDRKSKIKKYQLQEQMTYTNASQQSNEEEGAGKVKLDVIVKADVLGSLEAILDSLAKFEHPEVAVNVISKGLGSVTEADVERAASSNARILAFHVAPNQAAQRLAVEKQAKIEQYEVIYKLVENVRAALESLLKPEVLRQDLGRAKVLAIFRKDKDAMVVGGQVTKGKLVLQAKADVLRNDVVVLTGTIGQLQQNKIVVDRVEHGKECGIRFVGKPWLEVGDVLEVYEEEVKVKKLA